MAAVASVDAALIAVVQSRADMDIGDVVVVAREDPRSGGRDFF